MKLRNHDLTTGEAARLLRMGQQTVIRMIDEGRLTGYRLPGSRVRRVTLSAVKSLAAQHGIPLDESAVERLRESDTNRPRGLAGAGDAREVPESAYFAASGNTGRRSEPDPRRPHDGPDVAGQAAERQAD